MNDRTKHKTRHKLTERFYNQEWFKPALADAAGLIVVVFVVFQVMAFVNRVPDPAHSIRATNYKATLPSGLTVELYGISRVDRIIEPTYRSVNSESWNPSGAPYQGEELSDGQDPTHVDKDSATIHFHPDTKRSRCLAFHILSPNSEQIAVYGYVPSSAYKGKAADHLRGFGRKLLMDLSSETPKKYRTVLEVANMKASRYFLAIGDGEWTTLGTLNRWPSDFDKTGVSLIRPWGTVHLTAHHIQVYSGPEMFPDYIEISVLPSSEPPQYVYRISLYDKANHPLLYVPGYGLKSSPVLDSARYSIHDWPRVDRIEVEGRELTYIEFTGVHYNPR